MLITVNDTFIYIEITSCKTNAPICFMPSYESKARVLIKLITMSNLGLSLL